MSLSTAHLYHRDGWQTAYRLGVSMCTQRALRLCRNADVFALLSCDVLGERLLVMGKPPVEAYALYERATQVYVQTKSMLDGSYARPRRMMIRQACLRKLCAIEETIVIAQEKGALLEVVEGCSNAMNLVEEEFNFDLGKSIHRLQQLQSETMCGATASSHLPRFGY